MKKVLLSLLPVFFIISNCAHWVKPNFGPVNVSLNAGSEQSRYKRIAIIPYDVSGYDGQGMDKVSGTALADRYTHELMRVGYDVIERQRLEILLKEHELNSSDLFNQKKSAEIGNLLGVQAFVFGSVSGRPGAFSVMTKMVDVETGSTVWSVVLSNNIEKNAMEKLKLALDAHYAKGGK
jgi:TolB-like protein